MQANNLCPRIILTYLCVFCQLKTGLELEVEEQVQLLEWFANNYKNFGTNLQIVTDKSQEGSQFCKGFGGIGGE